MSSFTLLLYLTLRVLYTVSALFVLTGQTFAAVALFCFRIPGEVPILVASGVCLFINGVPTKLHNSPYLVVIKFRIAINSLCGDIVEQVFMRFLKPLLCW